MKLRFLNFGQTLPLYHGYANGATKGAHMAKIIKKTVLNLQQRGYTVVACICDQGRPNIAAAEILRQMSRAKRLRKGEPER